MRNKGNQLAQIANRFVRPNYFEVYDETCRSNSSAATPRPCGFFSRRSRKTAMICNSSAISRRETVSGISPTASKASSRSLMPKICCPQNVCANAISWHRDPANFFYTAIRALRDECGSSPAGSKSSNFKSWIWRASSDQFITDAVNGEQMLRLAAVVAEFFAELDDDLVQGAGGAIIIAAPGFVQ